MSETPPAETPTEHEQHLDKQNLKRPRPVLSCLECRRKKLKCDRTLPCQQCRRSGRAAVCAFQSGQEPLPAPSIVESPSKRQRTDIGGFSSPANHVIEALQARVERLEHELSAKEAEPSPQNGQKDNAHLPAEDIIAGCGVVSLCRDTAYRRLPLLMQFPDARRFLHDFQTNVNDPEFSSIAHALQSIHSTMKAQHKLKDPKITLTCEEAYQMMLGMLPPRPHCDVLVDLYFENFEHCTRILVKPCFTEQYEQFWDEQDHFRRNVHNPFLPALIGILSIASSLDVVPECANTLLHGSATRPGAVAVLRNWLESLPFKRRDSLAALQVRLLTMLPQRSRLARTEDLWSQNSQLVRHALLLSLHRDPATISQVSILEAETRRRLWYSVIEQDLTLSVLCNLPCMIPPYTTRPPLNVNDEDLKCGTNQVPAERPLDEWSDSLCQHFLATSLQDRIAVYALMNNEKNSYTRYEDVLHNTRRLEKILCDLPYGLQFGADKIPGRLVARINLDIHIRRLLLSIYASTSTATQDEHRYAEVKKAFTQASLVMLCYQDLFDPKYVAPEDGQRQMEGYWDFYYNTYRHQINQSTVALCFEIQRLSRNGLTASVTSRSRLEQNGHQQPNFSAQTPPQTWTRSSMIKTMDETLEPMIRRITRYGASMKDLAGLAICFSLVQRPSSAYEVKSTALKGDLRALTAACKAQFERAGILLLDHHTEEDCNKLKDLDVSQTESSLTSLDFDILLKDFLDPSFEMGWTNGGESQFYNNSPITDAV